MVTGKITHSILGQQIFRTRLSQKFQMNDQNNWKKNNFCVISIAKTKV